MELTFQQFLSYSIIVEEHSVEADVFELVSRLSDVRANWYNLGGLLKLNEGDLRTIEAQYPDINARFREMLSMWLRRSNPSPTWESLLSALRDPMIGQGQLANKLERNYISGMLFNSFADQTPLMACC